MLSQYLVTNDAQRTRMRKLNIHTMNDIFLAVWCDSNRIPKIDGCIVVLKGRLLGFLNQQLCHTYIDLNALRKAGVVKIGGRFPDQYIGLVQPTNTAHHARAPSVPRPHHLFNNGYSDEMALAKALQESFIMSKPAPLDLCCPITLEPYRDPVCTIHGQTYDRSAIEKWFRCHSTDPLTNEVLPTKVVWEDSETAARVAKFYAEA